MNRNELNRLEGQLAEKGLSCVPLKLYFKRGRVKVEIGIGRGKKKGDKRQSIKEKDSRREIERTLKKSK